MKTSKPFLPLPLRFLFLCFALLMPLVACSDDDNGDNGDSGQKETPLTVYQQLQSAADKSLTVDDIVSSESFTVFTLSDNSKIELQRRNNVVNLESEESKNVFYSV